MLSNMGGGVAKRAYKYRFYPNPEQAEQLNRTFGCVRYVYNRALAERSRAWTQEQRGVTHAETDRDHLHKLTTRIVRENQTIVIEDLAVRNMVKNRSLARAISDASWSELRRMLEYKADW